MKYNVGYRKLSEVVMKSVEYQQFSDRYLDGMTAQGWFDHTRQLNELFTNYHITPLGKHAYSQPNKSHQGPRHVYHKTMKPTAHKIKTSGQSKKPCGPHESGCQ